MSAIAQLLLNYEQAAKSLSLTRAALRDLVYKNKGPAVVRLGRRTLFAVSDLQDWIGKHRVLANAPSPLQPPLPMTTGKRRRGRPTIAEEMAREAAMGRAM